MRPLKLLTKISLLLLIPSIVFAQPAGKGFVSVTEEDGSPTCFGWQAKFANGNVTDNGDGTCSIADQTGAGGGDAITVNTTAVVDPDFQDSIYVDVTTGSNIINWKFNYNAASGDIALLTNEVAFALNGLVSEGTTADTIEGRFAFPDWATSDKVWTWQDATDTVVGRATTDTLTNKTLAAANNVVDADTAVALAANGSNCAANSFPLGVDASGAVESCSTSISGNAATVTTNANLTGEVTSVGNAATIADTVTVTGWVMGASTATTPAIDDNDTSLATTAFVNAEIDDDLDASAELIALVDDETGTGVLVFGTSPRITTSLLDSGGNELFKLTATGTAVNEFTVANAAASGDPTLSVTGDSDANIDIALTAKGTGGVIITSTNAGPDLITHGLTVNNDGLSSAATDDFVVKGETSDTLFVVDASAETITSGTTGSIGWAVVGAANQACNTTCTSGCVVGFDTGLGGDDLVDCASAIADRCLCAGSS